MADDWSTHALGNIYALRVPLHEGFARPMSELKPREIVGANVKRLRSRARLTQAHLAEAADVSDETISRIERGAYEPSLMTACAIAKALRVTVEDLAKPGARSTRAVATPSQSRTLTERTRRLSEEGQRTLLKIAEVLLAAERHRKK